MIRNVQSGLTLTSELDLSNHERSRDNNETTTEGKPEEKSMTVFVLKIVGKACRYILTSKNEIQTLLSNYEPCIAKEHDCLKLYREMTH